MTSRLGFRQHVMLILVLDILFLIFTGFGSTSFLAEFIANPSNISFGVTGSMILLVITIFAGISSIGVTTGSNFVGATGIFASLFGKFTGTAKATASLMPLLFIVGDYVLIWTMVISDQAGTWGGNWMTLIALLIFSPLVVDGIFASMDWARGVTT